MKEFYRYIKKSGILMSYLILYTIVTPYPGFASMVSLIWRSTNYENVK